MQPCSVAGEGASSSQQTSSAEPSKSSLPVTGACLYRPGPSSSSSIWSSHPNSTSGAMPFVLVQQTGKRLASTLALEHLSGEQSARNDLARALLRLKESALPSWILQTSGSRLLVRPTIAHSRLVAFLDLACEPRKGYSVCFRFGTLVVVAYGGCRLLLGGSTRTWRSSCSEGSIVELCVHW